VDARRFRAGWILALVTLASVLAFRSWRSATELRYHGVPFRLWLRAGTNTIDQIDAALGELGPAAIPSLCRMVQQRDSGLRRTWQKVWLRLPTAIRVRVPRPNFESNAETRHQGFLALQRCGSEARTALPVLLKLERQTANPQTRADALLTLASVGPDSPEVVSALIRGLTNTAGGRTAATALALCGPHAQSAVSSLIRSLQASLQLSNAMPRAELIALAAIGPGAAPALPEIAAAARLRSVRPQVLTALKWIGPAPEHLPLLLDALRTGTSEESYLAIEALMRLGPGAQAARADLQMAATGTNPVLRVLAAVAMARLEHNPAPAVAALTQEIRQSRFNPAIHAHWSYAVPNSAFSPPASANAGIALDHRGTAAWHLGEMGPAARDALPALEALLQGSLWQSLVAAEAIWKITGEADRVLPKLIAAVDGGPRHGQAIAIRILAEIGPAARPAVPTLLKVRSTSMTVRREVNAALRRIDPLPDAAASAPN
jgi:hypothetical protein